LAKRMPVLAFFFVLFALSSIGLPGLNGFVSEFTTILGAFTSTEIGGGEHRGIAFGVFAALGIILGAVYMLHMVARVIWGPLKYPHEHEEEGHGPDAHATLKSDIGGREIGILIPLALAVVLLGVFPNAVLRTIDKPVAALVGVTPRAPTVAMENALPQSQPKDDEIDGVIMDSELPSK
jgi:NADH-quinone oxidoreductase subunit M